MKKAHEVLGSFIHHPDPTDAPIHKALDKIKDGKFAQALLKRIHSKVLWGQAPAWLLVFSSPLAIFA